MILYITQPYLLNQEPIFANKLFDGVSIWLSLNSSKYCSYLSWYSSRIYFGKCSPSNTTPFSTAILIKPSNVYLLFSSACLILSVSMLYLANSLMIYNSSILWFRSNMKSCSTGWFKSKGLILSSILYNSFLRIYLITVCFSWSRCSALGNASI